MLAQLTASTSLPKSLNASHLPVLLPKGVTLPGDADHILAARFLKRFLENDVPWLHVDPSASRREGGSGGVASEVTGFGVVWDLRMRRAGKLVP